MLKSISILIFILLTEFVSSPAQQNIKGSGYILTQQREIPLFNSIEVSQHISVYITPGEFMPITIEADDNLFPYIKTVVRNKILKVYIPDTVNITKYADMNVLISMPALSSLLARQAAHIEGSLHTWEAAEIEIKAGSGSRIKLAVNTEQLKVTAKTSAIVELKGKTHQLEANLKTAARLYARELEAEEADIQLATSAKADIRVSQKIEYDLCGNAKLIYRGNPETVKLNVNSGSKVIHDR